ncbi:MAG: hypothetical protein RL217_469 [Pseudomonadota bacterium]|jgi:cobalamin biosynthetic protein CobC
MAELKPTFLPLEHGANLSAALIQYGGEASSWLDISAAVSPYSWAQEHGPMPVASLQHLPFLLPELALACRAYYGQEGLLCAGSMQAIRALARCFSRTQVWVQDVSFAEHELSWRLAGHEVLAKSAAEIEQAFLENKNLPDVLILVSPNNPTAQQTSSDTLRLWAKLLQQKNGYLIVDEAFIDCLPNHSLLAQPLNENTVVLRSLGKFFGLAGARVGFVFAAIPVREALATHIGPWPVALWVQHVAATVLQDEPWQKMQRARLAKIQQQLLAEITQLGFTVQGAQSLFITLAVSDAKKMQRHLAKQRIWVRAFVKENLIRLGLPKEIEIPRLVAALKKEVKTAL